MPSNETIVVNIMGVNYPIKGNFDRDYILKISEDLDNRMRELSDQLVSKSAEKTAVLTALNLEDELYSLEDEKSRFKESIEKRVKSIISKVDKAIAGISG
ncbi:MAG: cell division protein ZapA [FCB group bacterium]|nr:cell division protein ZapA [FCB group bacterium]